MKKINVLILLFLFGFQAISFKSSSAVNVWLIGDSTMAEKKPNTTERGWGMLFSKFVDPDQATAKNYGKDGRSTKSFIDEGWWKIVLDSMKAGDYVLIQFGHNDEKTDVRLHTDPATTFRDNLKKFVIETRAKGATPILFTPIVRRSFDAEENLVNSHGHFPEAIRETANQLHVPMIDMELQTRMLESIAGWDGTHKIHQFEPPKEIDNTHLCNFGAYVVAPDGIRRHQKTEHFHTVKRKSYSFSRSQ